MNYCEFCWAYIHPTTFPICPVCADHYTFEGRKEKHTQSLIDRAYDKLCDESGGNDRYSFQAGWMAAVAYLEGTDDEAQ